MTIYRLIARYRNAQSGPKSDKGMTLIELLIVTLIIPIIVGALAAGLLAVFSLQSSAANRISDTSDAQIVSASFESDVQGALAVTTENTTTAPGSKQCGTGFQVLGLEWSPNSSGVYQTVVSYVEAANASTNGSVNLVRQYCSGGNLTNATTSILSYDFPPSQATPLITLGCSSSDTTCNSDAGSGWVPTSGVTSVTFSTTEQKSQYSYALVSAPADAASSITAGAPITVGTTTQCGDASAGTGLYASSICFADFSPLEPGTAAYAAATAANGCLEMSVLLPNSDVLYFCINISGSTVKPSAMPTFSDAFLGNTGVGTFGQSGYIPPNYIDVPGNPALYQTEAGTTTITFTGITVDSPQGIAATGWEAMSADAESTDYNGESITWNTDPSGVSGASNPDPPNLYVVSNGLSVDTPSDPVGNACLDDQTVQGLTGSGTTEVECAGDVTYTNGSGQQVTEQEGGGSDNTKTGTAMLEALMPTTLQVTMVGGGIQAIVFGLFLS